jgi:putative addiction module killer protein
MHFGPGYHVYYVKYGKTMVILLAGGDKSCRQKGIEAAKELWERLKDDITEL